MTGQPAHLTKKGVIMLTVIERAKANQLHHATLKILIERAREKLGLKNFGEVFDWAGLSEGKSDDHVSYCYRMWKQNGTAPDWLYNYALDVVRGVEDQKE